MGERRDIIVQKKGGNDSTGKRYYAKIGSAWFNDNGSVSLRFDALPIDGEAFVPSPDNDRGGSRRGSRGSRDSGRRNQRQQGNQRQQELPHDDADSPPGDANEDFPPGDPEDDIPY